MSFRAHIMEKIRQLVGIHYQLDRNSSTYLRNLREDWAFLDPNSNEVYTIGNIKWTYLTWLLAGDRPIYLTGNCSCNQSLLFYRSRQLQPWSETPHLTLFHAILLGYDQGYIRHTCYCNKRSRTMYEQPLPTDGKKHSSFWAQLSKGFR